MMPDQLETAHLTLRPFQADDANAVLDYWQSDLSWEQYNASVPEDFGLADAKDFVKKLRSRDRSISPSWAISYHGNVVGVVSLALEQGDRIAAIGYGVHGDLRGRGLSVEAVRTVINEAFQHYARLEKLRAHTDAENASSMRVLEKLGFSHEGTLRKNQFAKGRYVDEAIFGLLREEWIKK